MDLSKIQWTGATWNPWHGCVMVSSGCTACYMYRDKIRYAKKGSIAKDVIEGIRNVVRSKAPTFNRPYIWNKEVDDGKRQGTDTLVFTCSWSDWFIDQADSWRDDAWEIVRQTPNLTYQILTKRPQRIKDHLPEFWDDIKDRVWLGTSVEDHSQLHRITHLEGIDVPVRFVSFEPLIGPIHLDRPVNIQWFIVGGESGTKMKYGGLDFNPRPMEYDWVADLLMYAQHHNIPFFMKQLGTVMARQEGMKHSHGGDMGEWPVSLKIRQFPTEY